jgi:hypothetical protein
MKHQEGIESLNGETPSKEEIDLVCQRWGGLVSAIKGMYEDIAHIEMSTHFGPELIDARIYSRLQKAQRADSSKQPTSPPTIKAIIDASASGATSSEAVPSSSRIHLWWRRWWKRVASFLSFKRPW